MPLYPLHEECRSTRQEALAVDQGLTTIHHKNNPKSRQKINTKKTAVPLIGPEAGNFPDIFSRGFRLTSKNAGIHSRGFQKIYHF